VLIGHRNLTSGAKARSDGARGVPAEAGTYPNPFVSSSATDNDS